MKEWTGCEKLSDSALLAAAKESAGQARWAADKMLRQLAEIDRRRLYAPQGYRSMFLYCMRELEMSESEAGRRIQVCRLARKYPLMFRLLRRGALHLRTAAMLGPHLSPDNYRELLRQAVGKSEREVERWAASLTGRRERPDRVRHFSAEAMPELAAHPSGADAPTPQELPMARAEDKPDAAAPMSLRVEFLFTADEALLGKLERAKELLLGRIPGARLEHVLAVLLEDWLEGHDPEKVSARKAARKSRKAPADAGSGESGGRSRRIPARVRDAVYERDGGRCVFVGASGTRCEARGRLELDHKVPFALGGRSDDPSNLRLLCRAHNLHFAREAFGAEAVEAAIAARRTRDGGRAQDRS